MTSPPGYQEVQSDDEGGRDAETHVDDAHSIPDNEDDVEMRGLLSGVRTQSAAPKRLGLDRSWNAPWSNKRVAAAAALLVVFIIGTTLARPYLNWLPGIGFGGHRGDHRNKHFGGDQVRSNGTHAFKRTVLMVSIDGLRADYLERGLTPHLLDISHKGLRADFMRPIFPTLTFPNHWSLLTGLHAESHGIVGNNFWDPKTQTEFHYNKESSTWVPDWWLGEPVWETLEKVHVTTANLMWPGPPKTTRGVGSTYFVPWKDKAPLDTKLHQLLEWLDLPLDKRPQLLLMYEPSLDQAGHKAGPTSELVNKTLVYVDTFAKDLHLALIERNLTDIVDVVYVSDHGMTDTSHPEFVYLDDILGPEGFASIEHEDGWPSMGLRFSPQVNASHYLEVLLEAARQNPEKFDVFTHQTMPVRYHFANSDRIAPIYVIPKMGYVLTNRKEGDVGLTKGNHGFDNAEPAMYATFVAHGPFSNMIKDIHKPTRALLSTSPSHPGFHSIKDHIYVMEGFANVEIYNLVMKLLGIHCPKAPNNGTEGFWDKYF